eukprot:gene23888-9454_t
MASLTRKEEELVQRELEIEAKKASLATKELSVDLRLNSQKTQLKANAAKELGDVRLEAAAQLHAVREACKACGVPSETLDARLAKCSEAGVLKKSSLPPAGNPYQPGPPTGPPRPSQPLSAYPYQPVYPTDPPKSSLPPAGNPCQPGPPTGPPS